MTHGEPSYSQLRTDEEWQRARLEMFDCRPDGEPVEVALPRISMYGERIDGQADELLAGISVEDMVLLGKFAGTGHDYEAHAIRPAVDGPGHTLRNPKIFRSFLDAYGLITGYPWELLSDMLPSSRSAVADSALEASNMAFVQNTPSEDVVLGYRYLGESDSAGRPTSQTFAMKLSRQQFGEMLRGMQHDPLLLEAVIRRSPLGQALSVRGGIGSDIARADVLGQCGLYGAPNIQVGDVEGHSTDPSAAIM